ncbi:hypothetical protein QVD17_41937 [Tagetes erecta]|uniref:Protein kinase domain-containing protein n=1 Tax=Tagetes erecta TaxID=13708 RepID=A0AAD8NE00_TARER|nr:hypothetical protein QVD17_41937 [Tagetes erecta]
MEQIFKELEDALELQWNHEKLKESTVSSVDEGTTSNSLKLEWLKIPLREIRVATNNFDEEHFVGAGGFGMVYKGELDVLDIQNLSSIDGTCKDIELPKRRRLVAIKQIINRPGDGGTDIYMDPEYLTTSKYKKESDIYSFGVVLFEILSGRPVYDSIYTGENAKGLAPIARRRFNEGTIKELLDPKITQEDDNEVFTLNKGPNQESFDVFSEIAYMCLAETQAKRPTMKVVIKELEKASRLQGETMILSRFELTDILSAIENFSDTCRIGLHECGKDLEPKIAYFGISSFDSTNQEENTKVYWDPEFEKTRVMKQESDIFSFGVILFEIFCGRLAYDFFDIEKDDKGLVPIVRNHFNDIGAIKTLLDPKLKDVPDDDIFTSNRGPDQDSLDTFLKIAYQCLDEAPFKRPTMEIVIKELKIALDFQENRMKSLQISLKDIQMATENFSQKNWFGSGRYWEAYKGEIPHANVDTNTTIVAKRLNSNFDDQFRTELDVLLNHKHDNIIGLVGYCNEENENIIVYEHMSKGSLDKYLKDSNLRWMKRLQICIEIASALKFLHADDATLKKVIHRNIKSHVILLNDDWNAKISSFELSALDSLPQDMEHINEDGYLDPKYKEGFLTEKSDIYSFGVVLFEILCGRLAWVEGSEDNVRSIGSLAKHYYEQGKLDEMVFDDVKNYKAGEVAIQLKKALKLQEDFEIWEPKLPPHYKEIMLLSETPEIDVKKDIYDKFSKGILLPKEKEVSHDEDNKNKKEVQEVPKLNSDSDHTRHLPTIDEQLFPRALIEKKQHKLSATETLYNPPNLKPFRFTSSADSRFVF